MLPASVSTALEAHARTLPEFAQWSAQVETVPAASAPPDQRLRSVLLHDGYGRVQAIVSEASILDLERLNIELGRELQAVPLEEAEQLRERYHWPVLPVLPTDSNALVVADQRILEGEWIYMPADKEGIFLKLPSPLMKAVLSGLKARTVGFGVRLPQISVNHHHPDQDLDQIKQAIQSFTSLRIQKRLEDTLEMPPLPETARRIINLRVDPNAGISDLADIVETDPSLAAQVVSWASSSFYAAPGKIRSVQDAIVRVLGYDLVMNLAMGLALGRALDMPKDAVEGHTSYWEQAVWTATLSGSLCTRIPKEKRPETGLVYLCGLLHSYGYLVLSHVFPPHFSLVCRAVEVNRHVDPENCEHHLLGITREQIGSSLMRVWNMPDEIVTSLRHQKNPFFRGEHERYSGLLYITTQLLRRQGIGDGPPQPIPQSAWEMLGLMPEDAEQTLEDLMLMGEEMQMLASSLEAGL